MAGPSNTTKDWVKVISKEEGRSTSVPEKTKSAPHDTDTVAIDLLLEGARRLVDMYKVLSQRQLPVSQQPETKSNNQIAYELLGKMYTEIRSVVEKPTLAKSPELQEEPTKSFEHS